MQTQKSTEPDIVSSRIETVVEPVNDGNFTALVLAKSMEVSEVKYEVHDEKRNLFGWRKKNDL